VRRGIALPSRIVRRGCLESRRGFARRRGVGRLSRDLGGWEVLDPWG
jgi:hypothetical protein